MPLSQTTFLYAAAGYCAVNAAVFTLAPQVAVTDSFGAEEAAKNRPVKVMTAVCGAFFAMMGTTALVLARGCEAATAVHCGLSVVPVRMAYDAFVEKIMPPPPAIVMTAGIVGAGLLMSKK